MLVDQTYYQIGSDVLLCQMLDPEYVEEGLIPPDGAWMLPIETYLDLPGVTDAARVGMYEASYRVDDVRGTKAPSWASIVSTHRRCFSSVRTLRRSRSAG
jgi:hypothetical protein